MRMSDWSSDVCSSDLRLEPHPEMGAIPELLRQTERLPRLARRRIQLLVSAANIAPAPHGYAKLPLVANAASRGGHAAIPRQIGITVAALFIDPRSIGRASRGERVCQYV